MTRPNLDGRSLTRGWWIVALVVAVSLGTAFVFTSRQSPLYRASATQVVTPNSNVEGTADILRSLETLERRSVIATFARIPSSPQARGAVARRLGLSGDPAGFRIEASVLPNTNILKIDVEGPDPVRVAAAANAAAEVTRDEIRSLYRIFTTRPLAEAVPPSRPVHPDPRRNYLVAVIIGLFLGLAAAFAISRLRAPPSAGA